MQIITVAGQIMAGLGTTGEDDQLDQCVVISDEEEY